MSEAHNVRCPLCQDDGWVDTFDSEGNPAGAMDCPYLGKPGHPPFNATGLLPDEFDGRPRPGDLGPLGGLL
jgi:hypothetical protein